MIPPRTSFRHITLKEDAKALDEVVVMGYGIAQKRTKVTNSIAKVSEKTLTVGANANPAQALAGAVSGVKVDITSGSPAATPSITIRGGSNYDGGSNEPLIIVDGVIRSSLSDINPNDIESMDVPRRLAQRAASMATLPAPTTAVTWMGMSGVS